MVRILKVKELEEQKRELLARSEMYRQTMKLQAANIKYSAALYKRRFSLVRTSSRLLGLVVPLVSYFFFRHPAQPAKTGKGLLAGLASGVKALGMFRPLLRAFQSPRREESKWRHFFHLF